MTIDSYEKEVLAGKATQVVVSWDQVNSDGYQLIVQLENWNTDPAVIYIEETPKIDKRATRSVLINIPSNARPIDQCRFVAAIISKTKRWDDVQCSFATPQHVRIKSALHQPQIQITQYEKELYAGQTVQLDLKWTNLIVQGYKIVVQLENWKVKPPMLFSKQITDFQSSSHQQLSFQIPPETKIHEGCRYVAAVISTQNEWKDTQCSFFTPPLHIKKLAIQWNDFGNRIIDFSGYRWRVKEGSLLGPGNNYFSASKKTIWVDNLGRLHLKINYENGRWNCAEIALEEPLGYGDYIFKTEGRIDKLDTNTILGLFLWEYKSNYDHGDSVNVANEFDIEFGTWKKPRQLAAQYVCQPWQKKGNIHRFPISLDSDDAKTSHAFLWHPTGMSCRSWQGHEDRPDPSLLMDSWFYSGTDLPRLEEPRIHINFWCIEEPPSDLKDHEVILSEFKFIPAYDKKTQE
ncbi:MAG: hypothetical protein Q8Q33_06890 [Chlamydiota bacterium]|nr:hypothetical protein [Chlamydiota bacterium]